MSSDRDQQVGAAIREIPVSEREPDFMTGLDARLDAADAEQDTAPPAAGPVGTVVPLRRRRRLVVAAAVVAVAVAAVFLVMLLGPGREAAQRGGLPQPIAPLGGPEPATAQQVIRASLRATGSAAFMRGVMIAGAVRHGRFVPGVDEDFLISSAGSYQVSARAVGSVGPALPLSFGWFITEPATSVQAVLNTKTRSGSDVFQISGSSTVPAIVVRDMAAGQPYISRFFPADFSLSTLRSYMLQLLDVAPLRLHQVAIGGKQCWVIVTTMASGGDGGSREPVAHRVRIAVDQQTLFPVRFTSTSGGAVSEARISYAGGAAPPAGAFAVTVPPGVHLVPTGVEFSAGPNGSSLGFKTIPFGDQTVMHDWIHDTPGFPTWMPDGFARTGATYTATTLVGDGSGSQHPEQDSCTVSLAYRRGFDAIFVGAEQTEHGTGFMEVNGRKYRTHFGDPFAQLYGPKWRYYQSRTRDVVIRSGPFAGRVGHIVVDPSVLPHLWVRDPMFTATVSGDLSAADMVRVVESLATGVQVSAGDATVR
jgi:hypothetical protein